METFREHRTKFCTGSLFMIAALLFALVHSDAVVPKVLAQQPIPASGIQYAHAQICYEFTIGATKYKVFPIDPLNPLRDKMFGVQAPVHVKKVNYDAEKRELISTVSFFADEVVLASLQKQMANYFTSNGNLLVQQKDISFTSPIVRGWHFAMTLPDGKMVTLKEIKPATENDITVTETTFVYTIDKDEVKLHDQLSRNIQATDLLATIYVDSRQILSGEARVTMLQGAWKRAIEKVLPDSNIPKSEWEKIKYVTRDGLNKLEQAVKSEMIGTYKFDGIDPTPLLGEMNKFVEGKFKETRLSIDDLRQIPDKDSIWTLESGKADIAADVRNGFKTKSEKKASVESLIESASKQISDKAHDEKDARKFHHWLKNDLKIDGKLDLIGLFGAEFHMDKKSEELTTSELEVIKKSQEKLHVEQSCKQYLKTKNEEKWEGEINEYLTTHKIFSIHRVANSSFTAEWDQKIQTIRSLPGAMIAQKTLVSLAADLHVQHLTREHLAEIELVKQEIATVRAELTQRRVDELGTMKPWFSTKLPKGWVWADGKSKFPEKADWVPSHLLGKIVPDMTGISISGAVEFKDIGQPWTGQLQIPAQPIFGNKFTLPPADQERDVFAPDARPKITGPSVEEPADGKPRIPMFGLKLAEPVNNTDYNGKHDWPITVWPGKIEVVPRRAKYYDHKANQPLGGMTEVPKHTIHLNSRESAPNSIMCRWIIYIGE